jgi:hypothetical protein
VSEALMLIIDFLLDSLAEITVNVIDVSKKAKAKNHVSLVIAVAADRPDIKPPSEPPVEPNPPPSDLCINTALIKSKAKIKCIVKIILFMFLTLFIFD